MRKTLLLAGFAAIISVSTLAYAQNRGPSDGDSPRAESGGRDGWREDRGWRDERGPRGMERGLWRDRDRDRHGGGGASFLLRNGTASVAVRCGEEPMQGCVDAALKLMDRARAAQPSSPPNAPIPQ